MIEQILPSPVVVVDAFTDPDQVTLFPEEEAVIAKAVQKRRREFSTVRDCARRALGQLGLAPVPILPGVRGAPVWPDGVVGSMTHCDGYRGAALAHSTAVATIGIDAEPHAPLPEGVLDAIALPGERTRTAALAAGDPTVQWDRLLFSAKESVYKAWFPLTGRWLGFDEADIELDPAGTFVARLLVSGPVLGGTTVTSFHGRFLIDQGLLLTSIAVPAAAD